MNLEVVVGPFHSSTAPLQVALLVLQQLKRIDAHILTHKGFTHLLLLSSAFLDRGRLAIVQNKILSRYFINAEAFFPFSDRYEHICYPRALIS
jgi:hypothetical protein